MSTPGTTAAAVVTRINLDCGGWFRGLTASPDGKIYGWIDVNGAWRSDDGGANWVDLGRYFLTNLACAGIAVTQSNPAVIYQALGGVYADGFDYDGTDYDTPPDPDVGIWKSSNYGASWRKVFSGTDSHSLTANFLRQDGGPSIIVHPTRANVIWAAAALADPLSTYNAGIYRSSDSGSTWAKVGGTIFDRVSTNSICIHRNYPNQIWTGGSGGLFASFDNGNSWHNLWKTDSQTRFPIDRIVRIDAGIGFFCAGGALYKITATDWNNLGTYQISDPLPGLSYEGASALTILKNDFGQAEAVLACGVSTPARYSLDFGATWTEVPMLMDPAEPLPVWLSKNELTSTTKVGYGTCDIIQDAISPQRWYATGGLAPLVTANNGGLWRYSLPGLAGVVTGPVCFASANPKMAFIPASDVGVSVVNDGGVSGRAKFSSRKSFPGSLHYLENGVLSSADGQILFAAGQDQQTDATLLLKSTNGGSNWRRVNSRGLPTSRALMGGVMAADNSNEFLVIAGGSTHDGGGIYRTTDAGLNFAHCVFPDNGADFGAKYNTLARIERDAVAPNVRYLSIRGYGLWKSLDRGVNWLPLSKQPSFGGEIWGLAADLTQGNRLWTVTWNGASSVGTKDQGLWTSADAGATWTRLPGFTGRFGRVCAARGAVAVIGQRAGDTSQNIYYSPDAESSWIRVSSPADWFSSSRDLSLSPHLDGQLWISGSKSVAIWQR